MDQHLIVSLFEWSYFVIIVGLVYFFLRTSHGKQGKLLVYHWVIFGFLVNFYGLSWLYTVYPLPWMEKGVLQLFAIFVLHLILSISTSLPYSLISFSFHKRIKPLYLPLCFASLLSLAEVGRALIISLLYYGKGTTLGLHFTAGTIGNALSVTPFIEYAYFGGTFALTFVLGYLVYTLHSKHHLFMYQKHILGIIVILLCVHFFVPVTLPKKDTTVGIVTTNFALPETTRDYGIILKKQNAILHTMTLSLASSSPMFIVYPEDTRYTSFITPTNKTDLLFAFKKTLFVDGDVTNAKGGVSNVSLFYYPEKIIPTGRGKEFLMPFSEYIPYFFRPLFKLFITGEALETYAKEHTYVPLYSKKTVVFNGLRIGTLICSEILSHHVIKNLKKEKPALVFFQSRLNVFHDRPWFSMHLMSFTKVAAAQMRVTIISSANNAPSLIVSPYGEVMSFINTGFSTSTYTVSRNLHQ